MIKEMLRAFSACEGGRTMIKLNDYLYDGDTVLKILYRYSSDLKKEALKNHNPIDMTHSNFLLQMSTLLEHNDFLDDQAEKFAEFHEYMVEKFPTLAFTQKGRIKSLIRAEQKFNGYVASFIYHYFHDYGHFPTEAEIRDHLSCFRDLIAYRIVISMPRCHLKCEEERDEVEKKYLYEIANALPDFMEARGFTAELAERGVAGEGSLLKESVRPYYRDFVSTSRDFGYQSLHITFYDNSARCYLEVQLRTKTMDDYAEIGPANHLGYEKRQEKERFRRDEIPAGECIYFDEAYARGEALQKLDLSKLDVNMFGAVNNSLINDGCGLFRGRLIQPREHLSRFQKRQ